MAVGGRKERKKLHGRIDKINHKAWQAEAARSEGGRGGWRGVEGGIFNIAAAIRDSTSSHQRGPEVNAASHLIRVKEK